MQRTNLFRLMTLGLVVTLLAGGSASAQDFTPSVGTDTLSMKTAAAARRVMSQPEPSVSVADQFKAFATRPVQQDKTTGQSHGTGSRRLAFGVSFGLAGMLLGAALEPKCHCENQGMKGAMIGLPVGALLGAWLGGR
jgi:hypothetical protein